MGYSPWGLRVRDPWTEGLVGYSPWGLRVRADLASKPPPPPVPRDCVLIMAQMLNVARRILPIKTPLRKEKG